MKSQNFHASDSALNSPRHNDDHLSPHGPTTRPYGSRRPTSSSRSTSTKSTSSYLKPGDKTGSASNTHPRYVLFLDKTRMPTFYNSQNTRVTFTNTEVEIWLRRLRILYQIDKGRNYGDVIDYILSILQFVPTGLLLPLAHITADTYATDEIMFNDIARARMYVLEEWAADGDPHRLVSLTESYRTMSLSAIIAAQQQTTASATKVADNSNSSFDSTIITIADFSADASDNSSTNSDD